MNGISALIQGAPECSLALPLCGDTARRQLFMNQKTEPHQTQIVAVMAPRSPAASLPSPEGEMPSVGFLTAD